MEHKVTHSLDDDDDDGSRPRGKTLGRPNILHNPSVFSGGYVALCKSGLRFTEPPVTRVASGVQKVVKIPAYATLPKKPKKFESQLSPMYYDEHNY